MQMEEKLEKLTDQALAARMAGYLDVLESLRMQAEYYALGSCPAKERDAAMRDYQTVRDQVRADAQYLTCHKEAKASRLLRDFYAPAVIEAAAWGFYADPADGFDLAFLDSLAQGYRRLTKQYSYDYWQILADR